MNTEDIYDSQIQSITNRANKTARINVRRLDTSANARVTPKQSRLLSMKMVQPDTSYDGGDVKNFNPMQSLEKSAFKSIQAGQKESLFTRSQTRNNQFRTHLAQTLDNQRNALRTR